MRLAGSSGLCCFHEKMTSQGPWLDFFLSRMAKNSTRKVSLPLASVLILAKKCSIIKGVERTFPGPPKDLSHIPLSTVIPSNVCAQNNVTGIKISCDVAICFLWQHTGASVSLQLSQATGIRSDWTIRYLVLWVLEFTVKTCCDCLNGKWICSIPQLQFLVL